MSAAEIHAMQSDTETLRWNGRLPRFASLREGGPGRPMTLMIWIGIAILLGGWGIRRIGQAGIDSGGPAMVFVAATLALFLTLWIAIKAGLRGLEVTYVVNKKGVEIIPAQKQKKLDRGMRIVSLVTFWLTLKGGQWARWHPFTPWKQVRRVEINEIDQEIRIGGGVYDIQLVNAGERFGAVCQSIRKNAPKQTRIVRIGTNA